MLVKSKAGVARTRRRMLLFSLPVVLLALFVAWKLLSMSLFAGRAIDAYDRGQFERSAEISDTLMFLNVAEDWIPYFNRGTAHAAGEAYSQATDDLAKALERAPEAWRCDVRVNLALAWELQGDAYFDAGYFAGAAKLYETAKAVLDAGADEGCFEQQPPPEEEQPPPPDSQEPPADGEQPPPDGQEPPPDAQEQDGQDPQQPDGTGEKLEQADDRVTEKLGESERQQELQDQQQDPDGDPATPDETEDSGEGGKVDELRDKGDAAEQEKQNQDATKRGQENNREYVEKPW